MYRRWPPQEASLPGTDHARILVWRTTPSGSVRLFTARSPIDEDPLVDQIFPRADFEGQVFWFCALISDATNCFLL